MSTIKKQNQEAADSSSPLEKDIKHNLPVGVIAFDMEGLIYILQQIFVNKPAPQMFQDGLIVGLVEGIAMATHMDRLCILGIVTAIGKAWGVEIDTEALAGRLVLIFGEPPIKQ